MTEPMQITFNLYVFFHTANEFLDDYFYHFISSLIIFFLNRTANPFLMVCKFSADSE